MAKPYGPKMKESLLYPYDGSCPVVGGFRRQDAQYLVVPHAIHCLFPELTRDAVRHRPRVVPREHGRAQPADPCP